MRIWRLAPEAVSGRHRFCCRFLDLSPSVLLSFAGRADPERESWFCCVHGANSPPLSSCSHRLLTWPERKLLAPHAFFFSFFKQSWEILWLGSLRVGVGCDFKRLQRDSPQLFIPRVTGKSGLKERQTLVADAFFIRSIGNCPPRCSLNVNSQAFRLLNAVQGALEI